MYSDSEKEDGIFHQTFLEHSKKTHTLEMIKEHPSAF